MAKRPQHQLDLLVEQELDIQAQEAQAANAVWYYTRVMCQLSLSASRFLDSEYTRESGKRLEIPMSLEVLKSAQKADEDLQMTLL